MEQKLTLFHLLNDIVQHSKKRNYDDLLDKFQTQIREAMPHLKNTKITEKVIRCLSIWSERQVFEDKFVQELITSIDPSQNREEQEILDNFQVSYLCNLYYKYTQSLLRNILHNITLSHIHLIVATTIVYPN